jgi:hypothetical protein
MRTPLYFLREIKTIGAFSSRREARRHRLLMLKKHPERNYIVSEQYKGI